MAIPSLGTYDVNTVPGLARRRYTALLREAVWNDTSEAYARIRKVRTDKEGASSAGLYIPIVIEGQFSTEAVSEGGNLPQRGSGEVQFMNVSFHDLVTSTVYTSRQVETLRGNDSKAIANLLKVSYQLMADGHKRQMAEQVFQDGSAQIGVVTTTQNSTTVDCNTNDRGRFVHRGQRVDFYTGATPNSGNPFIVTSVAPDFTSFTVSAPANVTANDTIHIANSRNDWYRGLLYHIANSGTYQGLSRADYYHQLSSIVKTLNSTAVTPTDFRQVFGATLMRGINNQTKVEAWTSPEQIESWSERGQELRRYAPGDKFDPSFNVNTMEVEGVPILQFNECPVGTWWFPDLSAFFWLINKEFGPDNEFIPQPERFLEAGVPTAKYIEYYKTSLELVGTNPRKQARITGAAQISAYVNGYAL